MSVQERQLEHDIREYITSNLTNGNNITIKGVKGYICQKYQKKIKISKNLIKQIANEYVTKSLSTRIIFLFNLKYNEKK